MAEVPLKSPPGAAVSRRPGEVATIRIATAIVLLVSYEGIARSGLLYKDVVPSLLSIARALLTWVTTGDSYRHLGVSAFEITIGFGIGTLAGVSLGVAFGLWRLLGEVLDPWTHYLAPAPKIIFFPVLILFFGDGIGSKIAMGAIGAFFPVVIATYAGMRLVPSVRVKVARSFQASTWQMVRLIYAPSLVVVVLGAMRIGLGAAIIGTLLAEIKMSRAGLGYLIVQDYSFLRVPEMYSLLIVIMAIALAANAGMAYLGRRFGRN